MISPFRSQCFFILLGFISLVIPTSANDPPKIQPFIFPSDLHLNQPIVATFCTAYSSDKPTTFEWLKDGKVIGQSEDIIVKNHEMYSILELKNLKANQIGNYTCVASNRFGIDSFTSSLLMKAPPYWTKEPESIINATIGEPLTINCSSSGYPIPRVTWRSLANNQQLTTSLSSSILFFQSVNPSTGGKYICFAENDISPSLSKEITIETIGFPAKVKNKNSASSTVSVKKGNKLEIDCEVEGDKPINMNWIKNSVTQNKFDNPRMDINELPTVDGIKSILTIKSVDTIDDGVYQCQAENKYGKDERTIRVTIVEPPPAPQSFMVHQAWSRSVNVGWSKLSSSSSRAPILGYVIRYWKVSSPGINEQLHEVNVSASMNSYLIKDIQPGTMFEATLMAFNEVGLGSPSRVISFTTGEEEPSSAPVDLMATPRGPSTIRVTWRPPPRDSHNGKLLGYYVGYRRADDYKSTHFFKTVNSLGPNVTHEYLLTSLTKATDYSITVKAFNSIGSGPAYEEVTVSTLSGDVAPSPRLHVTRTTVDSITLKYTLPPGALGSIDHLDLHFKEDDEPHWRVIDFSFNGKETAEYTLSGLNPSMVYRFYLTASNTHGASDPSSILTAKTSRPVRDAFTFGSVFDPASDGFGSYWNMITVLSITIAVAIIIIVIVIAFVFVRKAQIEAAKPTYEFSLASQTGTIGNNQSIPPTGTVRRFVDIDVNTNKPLMHGSLMDDYPTPYSKLTVDGNNKHSVLVDHHIYDCPR